MHTIAMLCLGSVGDVLPFVAVAQHLAIDGSLSVRIVTNAVHRQNAGLWHYVEEEGNERIEFRWVECSVLPSSSEAKRGREEKEEATTGAASIEEESFSELDQMRSACEGCAAVAFNLYSICGLHIAESLGVPSIALSPCIPPGMSGPQQRWVRIQLAKIIKQQRQQEPGTPIDAERCIAMQDAMLHWAGPALSPLYNRWRLDRLGMPSFDGGLERGLPRLVYGVSRHLVPCDPSWPEGVSSLDDWWTPQLLPTKAPGLDDPLRRFLEKHNPKQVCFVGLGSMVGLQLVGDPQELVRIFRDVLGGMGFHCVFQGLPGTAGAVAAGPAVEGCATSLGEEGSVVSSGVPGKEDPPSCLFLEGFVPHELLFPLVCLVVHHGGSGTVAAATRAGTPQCIVPCHFDQFQWAERVEHLGIGASAGSVHGLTKERVATAVKTALGSRQTGTYSQLLATAPGACRATARELAALARGGGGA